MNARTAHGNRFPRLRRTARLAFVKFLEIDGTQRAAAFAYHAFFSLFPLIILFVTLGSVFFDREAATNKVIGYVEKYVPLQPKMEQQVFDTIAGVIEARGQVGAVATIVLLWGSLQFFKSLVRATSRAWGTEMHNWWQMPLKSLALLVVLASALLLGIGVPVAANLAEKWLPSLHGVVGVLTSTAIAAVPMLLVFYGLALFYRLAPRRDTTFSEVWLAAAIATVLLRVVETLFSLYLRNFGNFNLVYGTFGGIMAFMLWIYLSGSIVVLGACIAAAQAEVRQEKVGFPGGGGAS